MWEGELTREALADTDSKRSRQSEGAAAIEAIELAARCARYIRSEWQERERDRRTRFAVLFAFVFMRDAFPFPEGDGSGPSSTALQCRDDPWHRSE